MNLSEMKSIEKIGEDLEKITEELENLIMKQETEGISVQDYKRILFLINAQQTEINILLHDIKLAIEIEERKND